MKVNPLYFVIVAITVAAGILNLLYKAVEFIGLGESANVVVTVCFFFVVAWITDKAYGSKDE